MYLGALEVLASARQVGSHGSGSSRYPLPPFFQSLSNFSLILRFTCGIEFLCTQI